MNEGQHFAECWTAAWNSGQLDRALALWANDMEFSSPLAAELTGLSELSGKAVVADYWRQAIEQAAHLQFTLIQALWDADARTVTIIYRRERGEDVRLAAEIIWLNALGLGVRGIALHGARLN